LGWRGGKAIAVTFGVWIGLTLWTVPLLGLVLLTICTLLVKPSGWAVLLTLIGIFIFLLLFLPEPLFLTILGLQSIILIWKHSQDLRQKPELRLLGKRETG
jgi:glycerol-3-phosphate acyltransferase PlsY